MIVSRSKRAGAEPITEKYVFDVSRKGPYDRGRRRGVDASALGNPFRITKQQDRAAVIALYRGWLRRRWQDVDVQNAVLRIKRAARKGDVALVCWCAPLPCHADVIRELLEAS